MSETGKEQTEQKEQRDKKYCMEEMEKAFLKAVPFPPILFKVSTALREKDVKMFKLGQDIAKDPVLSAQILKGINSPAYGLKQRISDIPHALSLMGIHDVAAIVFRMISKSMSGGSAAADKSHLYSPKKNWLHTYKTAILGRLLARQNNFPFMMECYLAGLLHDIGKNAIALSISKDDEIKIIKQMYTKVPVVIAEKEILGFNHAECGFQILKNMKLSLEILQAVLRHHVDMETNFSDMGFILALANVLSYYDAPDDEDLNRELSQRFGMTHNDLPYLKDLYEELKLELEAL